VWRNASINLAVLALFCMAGFFLNRQWGVAAGALLFVFTSLSLRRTLASHHRKAIRHYSNKQWASAIEEYQRSLDFFSRYPWVDRYRAVTMLSSGLSYREMGLLGLGFCYGQLGKGNESFSTYRQCLEEFPDSQMAATAVRLMESAKTAS
jgi:tetratricopeptide (TPR) repeat protein